MRQVAWLQARPRDGKGKPGETSRLARMQAQGNEPEMPDPGPAGYLAGYLWEVGPAVAGGMGPAAIGWADLQAWQAMTGVVLLPWEARLLRHCSLEYVAQLAASDDPAAPEPYRPAQPSERRKQAQADHVESILKAMIKPAKDRKSQPRGGITS